MTENKHFILADGHVHVYHFFPLPDLLNSAWRNFEKAFRKKKQGKQFEGVLFLTEMAESDGFLRFKEGIDRKKNENAGDRPPWTLSFTQETESLKASRGREEHIFIVAGYQISTSENLEVLALGTTVTFEDGRSLEKTIDQIVKNDAIAVIPWGVGKWLGKRGKRLTKVLSEKTRSNLLLGDNGGRPLFWCRVSQFELASKKRIKILRGTDPLPIHREVRRPGSFGFMIPERIDHERPSSHLKQLLRNGNVDLINYGSLQGPFQFFRNQLFLRKNQPSHDFRK